MEEVEEVEEVEEIGGWRIMASVECRKSSAFVGCRLSFVACLPAGRGVLPTQGKRATGEMCGKGWMMTVPTEPVPDVPNVFYYGDSISVGYTPSLTRKTKGRANLYHWMSCIYFPEPQNVVLRKFEEVGRLADYDCVVFNNGLHSLHALWQKATDEQAKQVYRDAVKAFRRAAPQAKLVYLNTTPQTGRKNAEGRVTDLGELNDMVLRLNRLAAEVMAEENVPVIDAYSLLVNRLDGLWCWCWRWCWCWCGCCGS